MGRPENSGLDSFLSLSVSLSFFDLKDLVEHDPMAVSLAMRFFQE